MNNCKVDRRRTGKTGLSGLHQGRLTGEFATLIASGSPPSSILRGITELNFSSNQSSYLSIDVRESVKSAKSIKALCKFLGIVTQ